MCPPYSLICVPPLFTRCIWPLLLPQPLLTQTHIYDSTTNEALCEVLECVVESVGLELLLITTSYTGGSALPENVAARVIQAAYAGILREVAPSNPILFESFQKSRIPMLTAMLGQMCPKYAHVALQMFVKEMDGLGTAGTPSDTQKLFLCDTLSCISMDFTLPDTMSEFSNWLTFTTTLLGNAVARTKKASDIDSQFVRQYVKLLDEVFRGGNFEESGITNCETSEAKQVRRSDFPKRIPTHPL